MRQGKNVVSSWEGIRGSVVIRFSEKKVLSWLHASAKNLSLSIYSPLKYRGAHLESGSSETRIRGEGVERGKLEGENPSPSCEIQIPSRTKSKFLP